MRAFPYLAAILLIVPSICGDRDVPSFDRRLHSLSYPARHNDIKARADSPNSDSSGSDGSNSAGSNSNDPSSEYDSYDTCALKGERYLSVLDSDCSDLAPTKDIDELRNVGWDIAPIPAGGTPLDRYAVELFGTLNPRIPTGTTRWFSRPAELKSNAGEKNPYYNTLYGPQDGVIVAQDNEKYGQENIASWSEVVWALWVDTCASKGIQPETLELIFRDRIDNKNTIAVIEEVYSKVFRQTTLGKRIELKPEGDTLKGFRALLGTPNGKGVAWLLIHQKKVLGKKIQSITVEKFKETDVPDNFALWEMWFQLG